VEQIAKAAGHAQRPQIPLDMEEDEADAMIFGSALPEATSRSHSGPAVLE
jgi:hypothetical protein